MADEVKILALEGWAMLAEAASSASKYMAREQQWVLGVTAYLMTSFVTGNVISAVWNIYLRSGLVA